MKFSAIPFSKSCDILVYAKPLSDAVTDISILLCNHEVMVMK